MSSIQSQRLKKNMKKQNSMKITLRTPKKKKEKRDLGEWSDSQTDTSNKTI
jgi:hypothetical protein